MNNNPASIFNNVIGPVMRGPSSSHTAASVRIGRLLLDLLGHKPAFARFTFDPSGSVASTYRGQGSVMGLAAGLLGYDIADKRLTRAEKTASEAGINIEYVIEPFGATHPNTYRCHIEGENGASLQMTALSTGGGIIRVTKINGSAVEDDLEYINRVMPVSLRKERALPFTNIDEFVNRLSSSPGKMSDFAIMYESAAGEMHEEEVLSMAVSHASVMKDSIRQGLKRSDYRDTILPHQSHLIGKARLEGKLIGTGLANEIIESVTAVMESKSAMEVIVAAPTAGSAGTLPGVLIPAATALGSNDGDVARALLAAGLFGLFIEAEGGFAAESGGCQYECGSASAMAAAALVEMAGGDAQEALGAGSLALQNMLGLICDPVADRVEVPCLGKNIMAAQNALSAANMIRAGYSPVIPAGEVIKAMKEVGDGMDSRYRCTCKGGLSLTPSAQKIIKRLKNG